MKSKYFWIIGMATCFVLAAFNVHAQSTQPAVPSVPQLNIAVDSRIADYRKSMAVSGKVEAIGSSTISNLLSRWSEGFKSMHPGFELSVTGGGSATAPPALLDGKCTLAPMSRAMKKSEIADFEKKFGYRPVEIKVAMDALAVYVHRNNPVQKITLQQLDSIFSSTRKLGGPSIINWGQLGADGVWANRTIDLYGYRNTGAGAYTIFSEIALGGGDFLADIITEPVSSSIVQAVGADEAGITYASRFFQTRRTHTLAISADGVNFYDPTPENALSGKYPLARFLYIYVNKSPQGIEPKTAEFLRFILSKQGQTLVAKDGNFPLNAELAAEGLGMIAK